MKKIIFTLITVLMAAQSVQAEDVLINRWNFPDIAFYSWMLQEYPSGVLTEADQQARTSIDLTDFKYRDIIVRLEGIHYFPNLEYLDFSDSGTERAFLDKNPKLKTVFCRDCNCLKELKMGNNTELTTLCCDGCPVLGMDGLDPLPLDFSSCTSLEVLNAKNCIRMQQLDLSNCRNLNALTVEGCTGLKWLTGSTFYGNNLEHLDVSGCTSLDSLTIYGSRELTKIDGLADCDALTYLKIDRTGLTGTLDLTQMQNLHYAFCTNNYLNEVKCYYKSSIYVLDCSNNHITSGDFRQCYNLYSLNCNNNQLTSLNVDNCGIMTSLYCRDNPQLTQHRAQDIVLLQQSQLDKHHRLEHLHRTHRPQAQ